MCTGKRPTDIMFKDERNIRKFTMEALTERGEQIVDPVLLEREYNSTNKRNKPISNSKNAPVFDFHS
ncbi:hypothetical protein TorRG33x02_276060 [Trema orientale]|uniref:Uncharacterized protein n=1 Tax=Trema orientale TaxID=63057 RepID=A0A2P5CR58_TREOI|nr:hypothetical protein TorRG33x02_276060 [Trema orientale]